MIGKPKYTYGDKVEYKWPKSENKVGIIEIGDSYGTFEQNEEHFNYQFNKSDGFLGISLFKSKENPNFTPKRILVIQMI